MANTDSTYLSVEGMRGYKVEPQKHLLGIDLLGGTRRLEPAEIDYLRRELPEVNADDFTTVDGTYLADRTGALWTLARSDPVLSRDSHPAGSVFWLHTDGMRAQVVAPAGLTLDDLRAERARVAQEQAELEQQQRQTRLRQLGGPTRVVTLADILGRDLLTPRAAAAAIVELGGRITVKNDRVQVTVPERLSSDGWMAAVEEQTLREQVASATLVLVHAREHVRDATDRRGNVDVQRLPDEPLPAGTLA
jgi:hypothetical protein